MSALLEIQDLHISFGPVKAVNGVDLTLEEGEFLALVGESGCGKSVTALSVTRLLGLPPAKIEKGKILFEGKDLLSLPEEELQKIRGGQIAYIFQEPATSLNPVLTLGDQIGEVLRFHRNFGKDEALSESAALLARVGIRDPRQRLRAYPHELSGGMKQRVVIAMALASRPKLLIADEPTTALDVTIQDEILSLLLELKEETGVGLLFITHDLSLVSQVADSIAMMYCGRMVERGKTFDVLNSPLHPYTVGLMDCVPKPERKKTLLSVIPGSLPDPTALPQGCHFRPRCVFRIPRCEEVYPPVETKTPSHEVRCFQAEQVTRSLQERQV
ncbi:MAG: ABC transporter ATP-binding protein [Candidatus Omnitrophota bacterium]